jgi:hypothetical protein
MKSGKEAQAAFQMTEKAAYQLRQAAPTRALIVFVIPETVAAASACNALRDKTSHVT